MSEENEIKISYKHAGFGKRALAYFIDIAPVVLITIWFIMPDLIGEIEIALETGETIDDNLASTFSWTILMIWIGICIAGENSKWQASPGKKIVGIKVIDLDGSKPNQNQVIFRNMAKILSTLVFNAGYFWAIFDIQKQTWHDKIAKTFVVDDSTPRQSSNI
jgi:uncharacterized RDD family membrane protein YckC